MSDCAKAHRTPTQFPKNPPPRPLPGNEEIFTAFILVRNCRVMGMAPGGFQWAGVAERLKLHDLWNKNVERGLAVCEILMLKYEIQEREDANVRKQQVARTRKR